MADAVCRVVARHGVENAALRLVSEEAGWSISSIRHYFATKADLLVFALHHAGDRIEERVRRLPESASMLSQLRSVTAELLPLEGNSREEALVWLAFLARACVDPTLAAEAEASWRELREPFVVLISAAVEHGELPTGLDPAHEGARMHALVDGLAIHLVAAPNIVSSEFAQKIVDEHLATLQERAEAFATSRGGGCRG